MEQQVSQFIKSLEESLIAPESTENISPAVKLGVLSAFLGIVSCKQTQDENQETVESILDILAKNKSLWISESESISKVITILRQVLKENDSKFEEIKQGFLEYIESVLNESELDLDSQTKDDTKNLINYLNGTEKLKHVKRRGKYELTKRTRGKPKTNTDINSALEKVEEKPISAPQHEDVTHSQEEQNEEHSEEDQKAKRTEKIKKMGGFAMGPMFPQGMKFKKKKEENNNQENDYREEEKEQKEKKPDFRSMLKKTGVELK
eukprot:gb/GECH01011862.1/.p1 GENE.gb/GECH01011862.1/~~gb/GECH01011862.1/.p1  ORF type:complete len:264 (+),score=83.38 gb/GECH01011862.1/:1-792(+)